MNFLSIDVGTTCCKCQLFDSKGEILKYLNKEYSLKEIGKDTYVDIDAIKENVFSMIREVSREFEISSICASSFGESFVLLDRDDNVLMNPMLYTDRRGEEEASYLREIIPDSEWFKATGCIPQAMFSISKILYIKNNLKELYEKADKALLICDYIGYILTGKRVIDISLAARTGVEDIEKLEFSTEILNKIGVDRKLFSTIKPTGSIVGSVKEDIASSLGLSKDTVVVLGSHDQVCTAIGSGCNRPGYAVDGLGTVECITPIFDFKSEDLEMAREGYVIVPFMNNKWYCTYIVTYASGAVIDWYRKSIMHKYSGDEDNYFTYMAKNMPDEISDVLVLPYLNGSSIPYQNLDAKGAILNITTKTKDSDIYKAILEGLSMEMRFEVENAKRFGIEVKSVTATGGGANSKEWTQMIADIEKHEVRTLRSSEGGLCGCAILQAVALKAYDSIQDATDVFVRFKDTYIPNKDKEEAYDKKYNKYKKIYNSLKEIF